MRILFVAISASIHTARWINQIADEKWEIHLFPSWDMSINPQLRNLTLHGFNIKPRALPAGVVMDETTLLGSAGAVQRLFKTGLIGRILLSHKLRKIGFGILFDPILRMINKFPKTEKDPTERERIEALVRTIKLVKPDIIHSMEIQHAGYLTLNAKKAMGNDFPAWIVSNWGSDIYHFGGFPEHAQKIMETLSACDYYACECQRDVELGRKFGFKGEVLPIVPIMGGSDLESLKQYREPGPPSGRKLVVLKGYQGWVYRALVGLQAIELCSDIFKERGYRLAIYLASEGVPEAAQRLHEKTGIPVEMVGYNPHDNIHILKLHGRSRVSIGLSMSDAISTSFLEAMMMGSFPVQSNTGCANEWVSSGESAFLVPPEDPAEIARALRQALSDDELVDRAIEVNDKILKEKIEYKKIQRIAVSTYRKILSRQPLA